MNQESQ